MATTVDEVDTWAQPGERGLRYLTGTVTNTAAETVATISPGNNTTNVTGSAGCRRILAWSMSDQSAAGAVRVVKSYSAANDRDELALTFTAGSELDWWVIAQDAGE